MKRKSAYGKGRVIPAVLAIVIFAAAFIVYANTLKGDFIWDDEYLILKNSQVKSLENLPDAFRTYVGYGSENVNNFYRPLQEISNMLDHHFWDGSPFGFHLTNVVLHSFVSALVFLLLFMMTEDIVASSAAGLLFAVHPVHSEAVAYVAGRADPLYALFLLSALALFVLYTRLLSGGKNVKALFWASLAAYAASLLSKELAVIGPVLVFMYPFFFLRGTDKDRTYARVKWRWVPFAVLAAAYMALRSSLLDFSHLSPSSILGRIPLEYRLLTFFKSILVYFRILLLPNDLHMERYIPVVRSVTEPGALFAAAVIAGLIALAAAAYRRRRMISFAITWFFVNLLPVSNIVPINSFMAEHWLYIPSIGVFLALGVMVSRLWRTEGALGRSVRPALAGVILVTAAGYGTVTFRRNKDWNNEIAFFESTLEYHPRNPRLYLNLGNTYFEKGELEEALKNYHKCVELKPDYAVAYGNIGSVYLRKREPERALEFLQKAVSLKRNYPVGYYNIGIIYFHRGDLEKAEKNLSLAVEQLPQMYQAWNMLGRVYLGKRDIGAARRAFERSLAIMPAQPGIKKVLRNIELKSQASGREVITGKN